MEYHSIIPTYIHVVYDKHNVTITSVYFTQYSDFVIFASMYLYINQGTIYKVNQYAVIFQYFTAISATLFQKRVLTANNHPASPYFALKEDIWEHLCDFNVIPSLLW